MNKSLNLLKSGHVINVQELKTIMGPCFISGQVIRQASVTSSPYRVKIELDGSRVIKTANCECAAGAGEKCKHIGAVYYYINNEESSSKTDLPQTWGKPSKAGEEKYKKGKQISELFHPKKPRLDVAPVDKNYFIENSNLLSLSCPLSYNLKIETQTQVDIVCEDTIQFIINHVEESINFDFYNSYLNTLEQSSNVWLENRKFRISASNKAHKIKTSKTKTDEKKLALAKTLYNNKQLTGKAAVNVTYGLQTENIAFEVYSKMVNLL
ncbi:zinc finger MYM-type protein 1-like, partial [Aphis craccivora]